MPDRSLWIVPNRPSTFIEITMYENDMYDFHAFDHVKKCLKKLKQTLKTTRVPSKTFKINKTLQKPGGCENLQRAQIWAWSVVTTMRTENLLSWQWRHFTSKSAMLFASLFCLKNDGSTFSSNIIAQWTKRANPNGNSKQCFHFRVVKNPILCLIFANISWLKLPNFPANFLLPILQFSLFLLVSKSFYTYYVFASLCLADSVGVTVSMIRALSI